MDVMCSWCHGMNSQNGLELTPYCIFCGHRADVSRGQCDCPKCRPTPEHAAGLELARKLCAVEDQRDALLAALKEVVATFGPWHADGCPADDTCDCSSKPLHDAINAAITKAEGH